MHMGLALACDSPAVLTLSCGIVLSSSKGGGREQGDRWTDVAWV